MRRGWRFRVTNSPKAMWLLLRKVLSLLTLHVHPGSPGTRVKEQPPCRYLPGAVRDGQRGCPGSVVSRLSGRGDTWLPAISLVKACHRAAANSGGQGGEPDILGALQATTWCSLFGGLAGLKEGSGDWQEMTAGLSQDGSLSPQPGGVCPQPAQIHHWQDPKE